MRQRLASSEVLDALHGRLLVAHGESDRRLGAGAGRGLGLDPRRRVVDVERDALHLAGERRGRRVRRRIRGGDPHQVRAVRHRGRVPDEDRIPHAALEDLPRGFAFAAVRHVVLQPVAVVVLGLPDERLQPLLINAASERRGGRRRSARGRLGLRRRTAVGRVVLEAGNLHVTGREGSLEDRPRRVDGDRRYLRTEIARQIRRGHRREHREGGRVGSQHGAPLEIARVRARDLLAVGDAIGLRPAAPCLVGSGGVPRAREDLHLAGTRGHAPPNHAPRRDRPGVADVRFVAAAPRGAGREGKQFPGIARRAHDAAGRIAQRAP